MPYDPTRDPYRLGGAMSAPAEILAEITPSDVDDLAPHYAKALYVGGDGDLTILPVDHGDGAPVTLVGVKAGSLLPVRVRRVYATGTTATDIVALVR